MNKQALPSKYEIQTPQDLAHIIRVVKKSLEEGVLIESSYWPKGRVRLHLPSFKDIPANGPWPDYIEYYFEELSTGHCFQLVCEIYHGHGGRWEICNCEP